MLFLSKYMRFELFLTNQKMVIFSTHAGKVRSNFRCNAFVAWKL